MKWDSNHKDIIFDLGLDLHESETPKMMSKFVDVLMVFIKVVLEVMGSHADGNQTCASYYEATIQVNLSLVKKWLVFKFNVIFNPTNKIKTVMYQL